MDATQEAAPVCTHHLPDGGECLERAYQLTDCGPRCLAHAGTCDRGPAEGQFDAVDLVGSDGRTVVHIEVKPGPKGAPCLTLRPVARG